VIKVFSAPCFKTIERLHRCTVATPDVGCIVRRNGSAVGPLRVVLAAFASRPSGSSATAVNQHIGGPMRSVLVRIETKFMPTNIFEGCPTIWIVAPLKSIFIAHPAEQIASWSNGPSPMQS